MGKQIVNVPVKFFAVGMFRQMASQPVRQISLGAAYVEIKTLGKAVPSQSPNFKTTTSFKLCRQYVYTAAKRGYGV